MMITPRNVVGVAAALSILGACEDSTAPLGSDVTSFTISSTTLPADGEAITVVSARISPDSRIEPRQVIFSTTAGTFSGQPHVTVAVSPEGTASAVLKAPTTPSLALVSVRAGESTLQDSVRFSVAPPALQSFTTSVRSVPADGETTLTLRAVAGSAQPRPITFRSSVGAFVGGSGDSIVVTTSSSGEAVAVLKAPNAPALAVVSARASQTTLQDSVRFVTAPPALQSFIVTPQTAAADGEATITLRAVSVPSASGQPRPVTFHSSAGGFVGGSGDSIVVTPSGNNEAVAVLRAPTLPALVLVRARAGGTVIQDTVRFIAAPPQLQSLTPSARELPADGASTITLRAVLAPGAAARTVRFGTTAGTLLGSGGQTDTTISVSADPAGVAVVLLKADTALHTVLIRASAGSTTIVDSVRFIRALPDRISLSSTTFRVIADPAQPITLTAALSRSIGQVTRGAVVQFAANKPDGTSLGSFGGTTTSNLSGTVTTSYTPGTTTYEGPVTITARTTGADGTVLTDTLTLEVDSP